MATGVKLGSMYWEAGLDNSQLQRGLDQSEQAVQNFGNRASGAFSALTVAAGTLLATGIEKLAGGILSIGANAISATADMQAMQVGLEGLLAREIARGQEATRTYQVTSSLTKEEQQQVTDLTLKLDVMNAKLQEKKQHLWEIKNRWTDEGLAAQTAAADIAQYENNIAKTVAQLEALKAKQGAVNTVTEKYWINTTSISDAMPQAQERAKKLMDELARISILSPYEVEAVQQTFKLAMAFGYTADEATQFTKAILNVAAGTGASNEMLQRMAYNFAQIRMQGKVTAVDIRQLAMAGFDLNSVLQSVGQQFGVTIRTHEDFNAAIANGSITWAQFTEGFAKYADDNFGGASERMSRTLNGLKSTFSDLFKLTLPKIVGPALEEVTGLLSDFLDGLLKIRETGILDVLGQKLGVFTSKAVAGIRGLAKLPGVVKELADIDPRNIAELNDILGQLPAGLQGLARAGADLINAFEEGGIAGALDELYGMFVHWWDRSGEQWLTDTAA
ncbi:MAG: tape measure protein, partial [Caldilinea sp.]|nr:tape measure protein [Caldilinea sp.]